MKEIERSPKKLVIELEEDESADLILRNRKTGEQRLLRTWFMPTLLSLDALLVWRELARGERP